MTVLLINCTSTYGAQSVVTDVEAGDLWDVNMGTTSKVSTYSNYALIECTNTRNLALMDNCPEDGSFTIEYSMNEPDSFAESGPTCKTWFLRGKL